MAQSTQQCSQRGCVGTYANVFRVTTMRDVRRSDYAAMCARLGAAPEPLGDGVLGFVRPTFCGHGGGPCKYAHVDFERLEDPSKSDRRVRYDWPWIRGDERQTWARDARVLIPRGHHATVLAVAIYGAPAWTLEEVQALAAAWRAVGAAVTGVPTALDAGRYACAACAAIVVRARAARAPPPSSMAQAIGAICAWH
jgi:hypothetical protein